MYHEKTAQAARGKWRGILMALGCSGDSLRKGRHGPCPLCGGKDRFRFDDMEGRGTSVCGQCGARDGMQLAMALTGQTFAETAARIDDLLGNIKFEPDAPKRELSEDDRMRLIRETYRDTVPMQEGDLAHRYLASRYIEERVYPPTLRFGARLRDGEGGIRPAMVALIGVHGETRNGKQVYTSMHRTFLAEPGRKADMTSPRKLMPGSLPDGACVMLSEYTGGPLGIAEGIETAMSASAMYDLPVWAALSASMLAKWSPPEGCNGVAVFGDHDPGFAGQAAAYTLAQRLSARGIEVTVSIPSIVGTDFADEWVKWMRGRRADA